MPDSLWPYRLQPTKFLCSWDSPGKNTGVGCHALLQGIFWSRGLNLHLSCLSHLLHWQGGSLPKWHPTPVFLPGKSHGWRNLVGYSPWGCKESDTTERFHFHFFTTSATVFLSSADSFTWFTAIETSHISLLGYLLVSWQHHLSFMVSSAPQGRNLELHFQESLS